MSFVAIYRWTIEEAHQQSFRDRWRQATLRLRALGGLGSCLTRDEEGDFVAIALWESEEARERAFAAVTPLPPQAGVLAFEESKLEVEDYLWAISPFEKG